MGQSAQIAKQQVVKIKLTFREKEISLLQSKAISTPSMIKKSLVENLCGIQKNLKRISYKVTANTHRGGLKFKDFESYQKQNSR